MSLLERQIEDKVNKEVKSWGILCQKVRFVEAGWPDRLYILPNGLHVWIEYKKVGEKPDPLQIYRIEELLLHNCIAGWTDDFTTAIRVLKAFMGAKGLYETSSDTFTRAIIGRVIPGPRSWEDCNLAGYLLDFERAGIRQEDIDNRTPTSSV
jgi:hypothetical protein